MPVPTRTSRSRPHGAPAYYLGRPVGWWITARHRQPPQRRTHPRGAGPAGAAPAGLAAG